MAGKRLTTLARRSATVLALTTTAAALAIALASAPAAPPATQSAPPDEVSDFGPPSPIPAAPAARTPSAPSITAPAYLFPSQQDALIGQTIERGISFLLTQFHNDQLAPIGELSESQLQALDALCVYALSQAAQSVNDPRLSIKGHLLNSVLDRLRSFELTTDAQKMNRPITYGRSLRAAALALNDRPADRAVLKQDVAWLIKAEIDGAYTYDDFYNELKQRGITAGSSQNQVVLAQPRPPAAVSSPTSPNGSSAQDFGGGSGEPGVDTGPYPPTSPTPIYPVPSIPANANVKVTVTRDPEAPKGGGAAAGYPNQGHTIIIIVPPQNTTRPPSKPYTGRTDSPFGVASLLPRPSQGGSNIPAPRSLDTRGHPIENVTPRLDFRIEFPWDNSNSQYGLLGVWAGAEVGMEVPDQYWLDVENHWLSCQLQTGEWTYRKNDPDGYFAMTCAGVASLLVTHDYLDLSMLKGAAGREPYSASLTAGINWLDQGDNGIATPNRFTHYFGYDLFGIERVGLASGYKFFGKHDWYRELADSVVAGQNSNGSWGHEDHGIDTLVDTAYSLVFLSRGRHPILMTKLKFDRYWDNRPRDVANLAKFASKQLERQINWQVVGIDHNWYDWFDSPVVFIASHQAPHLRERDYAELRKFVLAGGMILTHADLASANFDRWVPELAAKIAPGLPLKPIPPTDPIYSLQYKLPTHRPLVGISNGVRWLLVHSPNDLAMAWQQRSDKTRLADFQLGMNIFLYASGKPDLRNRIDSPFLPAPPTPPARSINLARLRFDGNWNPEPAAWPRFSRYLQWKTGQSLALGIVPIEKLARETAPIASLTGTGLPQLGKERQTALSQYVKDGGILVIDPCGGDNEFKLFVHDQLIPNAFAGARQIPLPKELSLPMKLRPYSLERLGGSIPQIRLLSLGKGYIIESPLDLTAALLNTRTWSIDGYQPESAEQFLANVIRWSQQ